VAWVAEALVEEAGWGWAAEVMASVAMAMVAEEG